MSEKLTGVHPVLIARALLVHDAMAAIGYQMMVTDGVRTTAEQVALHKQGRETPGPDVSPERPLGRTVTNADGITTRSNHQVHADGLGHALDCCFVVTGKPSWDARLPWRAYGELAKALGLKWGGDWPTSDKPHIELPEAF